MLWARTLGAACLATVLITACGTSPDLSRGRGTDPGGQLPSPLSNSPPIIYLQPHPEATPPALVPPPGESGVQFRLFDGQGGLRAPEGMQVVPPGRQATIGTGITDLDILFSGVAESAARQSVQVEGAVITGEVHWVSGNTLSLQLGPGKADDQISVQVRLPRAPLATLTLNRATTATIELFQRFGDSWRPLTLMDSFTPQGTAEVRLSFSKPVRRAEVETALLGAQSSPVHGLMTWTNDQTLVWQIAQIPPRLDFLLGGAHDQDGLLLPGGLPSLRSGSPPILVEVDLSAPADLARGALPPDILDSDLTRDGKYINFKSWRPGTTPWDWQTVDRYFDSESRTVKVGRMEGVQPRLASNLEFWVYSGAGTAIAGLITDRRSGGPDTEPRPADLVVQDLRGGRQVIYQSFISRYISPDSPDESIHLAWSDDGSRIAALNYKGRDPQVSDLVSMDLSTGKGAILAENLPVPASGTRLTWAPGGQYMLAGNLLVDLATRATRPLEGRPQDARGLWERGGHRLLYSPQDWGTILVIDAVSGDMKPLGTGFAVGWSGPGRVYLVRWPASATKYSPPGL